MVASSTATPLVGRQPLESGLRPNLARAVTIKRDYDAGARPHHRVRIFVGIRRSSYSHWLPTANTSNASTTYVI
jgi:hypothetical protein